MNYMSRNGISVRKVWKVGKSLVISFPARWVREGVVREGQEYIIVREQNRLVLLPAVTVPLSEVETDDLPR